MTSQPKQSMLRKSSGVALVTAIFLLVVLAGLAVAVVALTTTQQATRTQDELGVRAYLAAKAGMEWALFTRLQGAGLDCSSPVTFALPANTTLAGFIVTITCETSTVFGVAAGSIDPTANRITITATACNVPLAVGCTAPSNSPDYVRRVVTAQL